MHEHNHRIQDPILTHHMGYAEKPFHDLADQAMELGMDETHNEALRKANAAGVVAGKQFRGID